MRRRTASKRAAMLDPGAGSGEEEVMNRSEADSLWDVARVLAREAADVSRAAGRPAQNLPPLLFFTDPVRTPRPWETAARLPAGSGVVFRSFGAADARETGLRLREATHRQDGLLLVGLDANLAETINADGVHLPERALGEGPGLAVARPDWRIIGAVHSAAALAGAEGLDAAVMSPVFAAGGASAARPALGVEAFAALVRQTAIPVYALGGITGGNAGELIGSGACGLAGIAAIRAAFGPVEA
ncbi:MAG: thiamine phosphate synthase [Alphaproteobacteria bacterium]|nr:thiamine phosphate synthase [Alphaproteobacteria bacterium]MBU2271233.1 thiamine phosphate synthase [Alphaproteobacteria bacterium]MBU2417416.1 thiamine phosphate synthase [Alphaproteobacteria bacterium]